MNCSINDIAASLGLSRNTISKALNGKPGVSEKTRKKIIETAVAMKYRQFLSEADLRNEPHDGSIILLTKSTAQTGFWLSVMEGIKKAIEGTGLTLAMAMMSSEEILNAKIPPLLRQDNIRGLILVEVCNADVCRKLLTLGVPIVSVDAPNNAEDVLEKIDVVTMENRNNIYNLVMKLIKAGRKRFAFAGNLASSNTSLGFAERYKAFTEALRDAGLEEIRECSFTEEVTIDGVINPTAAAARIKHFTQLPDVYICGNDWTAIQIMRALSSEGIKVPETVAVAGFDDIPDSQDMIPSLTTIATPKELLGMETIHCILSKLKDPKRASLFITAATELKIRESTGGIS